MNTTPALALDIGGSKLIAGIISSGGEILLKRRYEWDSLDERSVMRTITGAARGALNEFGGRVSGIGAGIPGLADPANGLWIESCFSGINNVPISALLEDEFSLPVYIDNDVNLCALAEKKFGVCRGVDDFIWLTVSNGCGGAVFLNGELYKGASFGAGEFGHICVEEADAYVCGCGNSGCLEIQAAGPGVVRRYSDGGGAAGIANAEDVANLARTGDAVALRVFGKEGYYIGKALAAAINTVNPAMAVVGGGVAMSYDLFEGSMLSTLNGMIYKKANEGLMVKRTALGYYASLIGAGAAALFAVKSNGNKSRGN